MTIAIVILVMLLTLGYFYLKCSILDSLTTVIIVIIATILTFSYYEKLAELFVSRGYAIQWAHAGCYILVFVLGFALLRALRDLLIRGEPIDWGQHFKIGTAVVSGLISGIIICGNIFVAIGLIPIQSNFVYSRFGAEEPLTLNALNNPKKSFLNTDGFVTGLYSLISRGSMSSHKSFAVLHADYLSQIHLNRIKSNEDILAVTSRESLVIPSGSTKKPVRIWNSPDQKKYIIIRIGFVAKDIQDGGAVNPNKTGQVQFFPAQLRLVCKSTKGTEQPLTGTGEVRYPAGLYQNGKVEEKKLGEIISLNTRSAKEQIIWTDVAFELPDNRKFILLEFKQNAVATLPDAVPMTEEIEEALDEKEVKAN